MEQYFQIFDWVIISGMATGIGDIVGWVMDVEFCKLSNQYFYTCRTYSTTHPTIRVAQKFVSAGSNPDGTRTLDDLNEDEYQKICL